MADLLIRDLDVADKRALALRAAKNGRSQQAEARSILENALRPQSPDWVETLRNAARSVGGVELELPERRPAREIDVEGWL